MMAFHSVLLGRLTIYLANRKRAVELDTVVSKTIYNCSDVPQGIRLLFLLLDNNLSLPFKYFIAYFMKIIKNSIDQNHIHKCL